MGSGSGENFGSVLAGALGQGLNFAGQNLIPFKQQEKDNAIKDQLEVLRFAQEERDKLQFDMAQKEHVLKMEDFTNRVGMSSLDLADKVEDTMLTGEQRAVKKANTEAAATIATIEAFAQSLGVTAPYAPGLGGALKGISDIVPEGSKFDFGALAYNKPVESTPKQGRSATSYELVHSLFGPQGLKDYFSKKGVFAPTEKSFMGIPMSPEKVINGYRDIEEAAMFFDDVEVPTWEEYIADLQEKLGEKPDEAPSLDKWGNDNFDGWDDLSDDEKQALAKAHGYNK